MIDKIAKRLLEDQNLTGRTVSSLGSHPSWVNLFSFFLEHWNVNYFTQEASWKLSQLIRACSVATQQMLFWDHEQDRIGCCYCSFTSIKRLLKSSQKFLVCWDSSDKIWIHQIVIKIMYSTNQSQFIVYQRLPLP